LTEFIFLLSRIFFSFPHESGSFNLLTAENKVP